VSVWNHHQRLLFLTNSKKDSPLIVGGAYSQGHSANFRSYGVIDLNKNKLSLYSRDIKGAGAAHKVNSPKNQPQIFLDDDEVVLVK